MGRPLRRPLLASFVLAWHRLTFRWRRVRFDQELEQEIELHRLLHQEENAREGLSPQEAVELSRKQMGNMTYAKEECRNMWSVLTIERLLQDLRYAGRMFAGTPVFTTIAVASLALGIGSNAAMFSLVDKLLLRPLPYAKPDRLVRLTGVYPRAALPFFRQQSRSMEVAAVSPGSELNLTAQGQSSRVIASYVSPGFLSALGISVARGRSFESGEDLPGRDKLVIISAALWKDRFASDPAIVGRTITVNGSNREIVGVMPDSFSYPSSKVQLWIPMRLDPANTLEYWAGEFVPLIARLREGFTPAAAQRELRDLVPAFRKTFPYPMARDWNADSAAIPLQDDITGGIRDKLIILLVSVAMVLLIACANVANLLLSRATTRRKEMALRAALGAGRLRIIRQLLTESMGLAFVGAACGIVLGLSTLSLFKSLLPSSTPGLAGVAIDWRVLVGVTIVTFLTGLAFGLAPALSASQIDLTESMKTGSQRSTAGFWARFRGVLIAVEVGLTVVLVVSAGLLLRSLYKLSNGNPGFSPANVLTIRISPNQASCSQRSACIALYDRLIDQARRTSGVTAVAVSNAVPLDGQIPAIPVDIEGHPKTSDHPAPMLWLNAVSQDYLRLLGIPLLAGRQLNRADTSGSAGVVIVSATTARYFWPGASAIGKHLKPVGSKQWRTVVGVVEDVHQYTLNKALPNWIPGTVYMPYAQSEREDGEIPVAMTLLVQPRSTTPKLDSEIHQIAQRQDPNAPVGRVIPLAELVTSSIADFRATIRVFLGFAGGALLLAAIGIYGLMSYWVTQRTYEIGLRVAIGATPTRILSMIFKQGIRISLYGVFGGVLTALLLTRFLTSLLYGVAATDVLTFISVVVLVLVVAGIATAVPAWKAARIDPVKSLRAE